MRKKAFVAVSIACVISVVLLAMLFRASPRRTIVHPDGDATAADGAQERRDALLRGATMPVRPLEFPKDFMWGAASSAYQVQGSEGVANDWAAWEASQYPPEARSGRGTDFRKRFNEDFRLAQDFGVRMYRLSVEWADVEPEEGAWNDGQIAYYRGLVKALKRSGISVMLCANHFTLPQWLAERGGYASRDFPALFEKYVSVLSERIAGNDVAYWLTFNEPMVVIGEGYMRGTYPPGQKIWVQREDGVSYAELTRRADEMMQAMRNLAEAHRRAYRALHTHYGAKGKSVRVGMASYAPYVTPAADAENVHDRYIESYGTTLFRVYAGRLFLDMVGDEQDFIGINYYFRQEMAYVTPIPGVRQGGLGSRHRYDPKGLYELIAAYASYYRLPIIVTENGVTTEDDAERAVYLWEHLYWVHKAITDGFDVRGYFVWSLTDTWEWSGARTRFGLVAVDLETYERKPRPAAWLFKDITTKNALSPDTYEMFRKYLKAKDPD